MRSPPGTHPMPRLLQFTTNTPSPPTHSPRPGHSLMTHSSYARTGRGPTLPGGAERCQGEEPPSGQPDAGETTAPASIFSDERIVKMMNGGALRRRPGL